MSDTTDKPTPKDTAGAPGPDTAAFRTETPHAGAPGPGGDAEGAHYRQLVELSPDLVLLLDERGAVCYANLAAMDILRMKTPQDIAGRSIQDFFHDGETEKTRSLVERLKEASGETPIEEARFRRLDGTWFHAEMMASPFVRDGKHMTHLVVRDVTRRKDAEQSRKRMKTRFVLTAALLAIAVVAFGSYQFYEYTESTEFCGKFCHSVMGPDMALHIRSPHAHVSCAECHIGHGAAWYIKAKFSGFRQVYAMATGKYSRPIKTPITNLRPAMETCEECHSGRVYYNNRDNVYFRYPAGGDLKDPEITVVRLRVGGYLPDTDRAVGIHWHAGHGALVEYRTDDPKRLKIREIRVTERGKVKTFTRGDLPQLPDGTPWRTMDCTDCHNRVAHRYESPETAVDRLVFQGKLDISIPDLKTAALEALCGKYTTMEGARQGILDSLKAYYKSHFPQSADKLSSPLAAEAKTLFELAYRINVSPEMNIQWDNYIDLCGHKNDLGCFRCHDGKHADASGATVSQGCEDCHYLPVDGVPLSKLGVELQGHVLLVRAAGKTPG